MVFPSSRSDHLFIPLIIVATHSGIFGWVPRSIHPAPRRSISPLRIGSHYPCFPLSTRSALASIRALVEPLIRPALAAPDALLLAARACTLSSTGYDRPGPANADVGSALRRAVVSFAMTSPPQGADTTQATLASASSLQRDRKAPARFQREAGSSDCHEATLRRAAPPRCTPAQTAKQRPRLASQKCRYTRLALARPNHRPFTPTSSRCGAT